MGSMEDTTIDTVQTTLAFRLDPALGGCDHNEVGNPQIPKRDIQDVTIHEISGREQQFTHDLAGSQFMHHKSEVLDLDLQDDEVVSLKYYEEVSSLVKIMSDSSLRFFEHNADSSTGQGLALLIATCTSFGPRITIVGQRPTNSSFPQHMPSMSTTVITTPRSTYAPCHSDLQTGNVSLDSDGQSSAAGDR